MTTRKDESYKEVHDRLVQAMQQTYTDGSSDDSKEPDIDLSFLNDEYETDVHKRKRRFSRFSKIAAAAIIVLLGTNIFLLYNNSSDSYGDDSFLSKIYNGIHGLFSSENDEDAANSDDIMKSLEITDESDISNACNLISDLYIPSYIPDGYSFSFLKTDKYYSGDYAGEYSYTADDGSVLSITFMNSSGDDAYQNFGDGDLTELSDRKIFISWDDTFGEYSAAVCTENAIINISIPGCQDKSVLMKIAEGLEK